MTLRRADTGKGFVVVEFVAGRSRDQAVARLFYRADALRVCRRLNREAIEANGGRARTGEGGQVPLYYVLRVNPHAKRKRSVA
jgi:hypothetical protein